VPLARLERAGVMPIETSIAEVTVSVVLPEISLSETEIVVDPATRAVATPVALTLATAGFDELQVTLEDRSCFDPSEYTPVAVICCVIPAAIAPSGLPTEMKTRETAGAVLLLLLQASSSSITPRSNVIPSARKNSEDNPPNSTGAMRIVSAFNSFLVRLSPARS
jgi:hypothetical protein